MQPKNEKTKIIVKVTSSNLSWGIHGLTEKVLMKIKHYLRKVCNKNCL